MAVEIRLPTALRAFADKNEKVSVDAKTVGAALDQLFKKHDRLKAQLLTPEGKLRTFVNVYVNNEDVRLGEGLATPVADGGTVIVLPAMAGGAR